METGNQELKTSKYQIKLLLEAAIGAFWERYILFKWAMIS